MPCGICGFVGEDNPPLLRRMCDAIRHRGPDSTGYYTDRGVGLGIDRLKIIDLEKGDQPIHNEDGSLWVVFNGEVYNYLELRAQLEKLGHRFYTESDTETIVHAYEEWADDCPKLLKGMFAFAIWDSQRRRLYVARDRFGKKPLYYRLSEGVFAFASELKSLLQDARFDRKINKEAVDHYFTYGYVPSPMSVFDGISKMPAGHYGVYEKGSFSLVRYWDFAFRPDSTLDENSLIDKLYLSIENAVRIRLRSDVPLGAFLSGGVDSSTVVAMMQRLSPTPVKTVSVDFTDQISEAKYARQVADFLGTDHRELTVNADAHKVLPSLLWHFDEPFADHSLIPTYYVSKVTRNEVTVALSGDGGDELFMGYGFLTEPAYYRFYSRTPKSIRNPALRAIRALPIDTSFKKMANHALERNYGSQAPFERYALRMSIFDQAELEKLYSHEGSTRRKLDTRSYLVDLAAKARTTDLLDSLDYATIRSYLADDILVKVDRMSMANSLEVRSPLLDQDLADLSGRIPHEMKVKGTTTKYLLKRMILKKKLLPPKIVARKKQGFGAPVETWMKTEWKAMVSQLLEPVIANNYTGLFDGRQVKKLLAEPYLNSSRLFALTTFVIWHSMYIDQSIVTAPKISGL